MLLHGHHFGCYELFIMMERFSRRNVHTRVHLAQVVSNAILCRIAFGARSLTGAKEHVHAATFTQSSAFFSVK